MMKSNILTLKFSELDFFQKFTAILYLILAVTFFVSGIVLIQQLQKFYPIFFRNVRIKLWVATVLLSIPLLIRSFLNFIRSFTGLDDAISESVENDTMIAPIYNFFLFILADCVPISA